MKNQLIIGKMTLAAAVAMLTLNSCMRDNLEDCPPPYNMRLLVKTDYETGGYTRAAAELDWYDGQIDNVTVYAFDEEGSLVDSYTGPAYTMGEDYVVPFNLEPGKTYHFEAWTNSGERYAVSNIPDEPGLARRGEMTMKMNIPAGTRTFTENIPHHHQGTLEEIGIVQGVDSEHVIVIEPLTYKVNFIIRGPEAMIEANEYDVTVTDSNELHAFGSNEITKPQFIENQEPYFHKRRMDVHGVVATRANEGMTRAGGEVGASMILLQIPDDTGTSFDLRNTTAGKTVLSADLLEMIETVYTKNGMIGTGQNFIYQSLEDLLATEYEYTIVLNITPLGVEVTINDWSYEQNGGNL